MYSERDNMYVGSYDLLVNQRLRHSANTRRSNKVRAKSIRTKPLTVMSIDALNLSRTNSNELHIVV